MLTKWCYSILIVGLTFFGAVFQQQNVVPNQEIVLSFVEDQITTEEAHEAIVIVKQQLHELGVDDVHISLLTDGNIKLTYYSSQGVDHIKKALLGFKDLETNFVLNLDDRELPLESPQSNKTFIFSLDVSEIQEVNEFEGSVGKFALESNIKNDYVPNASHFIPKETEGNSEIYIPLEVNKTFDNNANTALSNSSRKIPEVRAGPIN